VLIAGVPFSAFKGSYAAVGTAGAFIYAVGMVAIW